jgi:hypothetical protein
MVQRIFPLKHNFCARRFVEKLLWHSMGQHYRMDRYPALAGRFRFFMQGERVWAALKKSTATRRRLSVRHSLSHENRLHFDPAGR